MITSSLRQGFHLLPGREGTKFAAVLLADDDLMSGGSGKGFGFPAIMSELSELKS
jgi:hypothetical protein